MSEWFIIDQLGEPFANDQILGFWIEDGWPTMGVLSYQPIWFGQDSRGDYTQDGPYGWVTPGFFGLRRGDGTWEEEPHELNPTHWMPLPEPPIKQRTIAPFIQELIRRVQE